MKAHKWDEPESVELTQWIKIFSKQIKSLPPSATTTPAGKGLKEVLFAISNLRHSAVHRLPTSAAGLLTMLDTAITFTVALNESKRAVDIVKIKGELAAIVEDIVQHQTLLERKLSDQMKDFARQRAEIDELERLAIEDMLNNDKTNRISAGSAVDDFLVDLKQASFDCKPEGTSLQEEHEDALKSGENARIVDGGTLPICSYQLNT